jgi:hypothetical protein
LRFRDIDLKSIPMRAVLHYVPRKPVVVVPEAKETLAADDDVRHVARSLFDHQMVDLADLLPTCVVDTHTFHVLT